jgi:hypothetical protein
MQDTENGKAPEQHARLQGMHVKNADVSGGPSFGIFGGYPAKFSS